VYTPAARPVAVAVVWPPGIHKYVYGDVPPDTVTIAVPFAPPFAGVDVAVAVNTAGCVIVTEVTAVQPLASVTVKLHVPAPLVNVPVPV
jgi:hypothetical protein